MEAADWLDLALEEKKKKTLNSNKTIESLSRSNAKRNVDDNKDERENICGLKGRGNGSVSVCAARLQCRRCVDGGALESFCTSLFCRDFVLFIYLFIF